MRLRREKAGVSLGLTVTTNHLEAKPSCVVTSIAPGSPAEGGGVHVGDTIVSINGEPLQGTTLDKFMQRRKLRNATDFTFVVRPAFNSV